MASVYADNARFSLTTTLAASDGGSGGDSSTASTSTRRSSRSKHNNNSGKPTAPGAAYAAVARRLNNVSGSSDDAAAAERLLVGCIDVLHCLTHLPATRHDVDNAVIDAFELGEQLALITVHSQFHDAQSDTVLAFSRVFTVAPAPTGSAAETAGWGVVLLNDQLNVSTARSRSFTPSQPLALDTPTSATHATAPSSFSFGVAAPNLTSSSLASSSRALAQTFAGVPSAPPIQPDLLDKFIYVTSLKSFTIFICVFICFEPFVLFLCFY